MSCETELEIGPGTVGGEFTIRVVRAASGGGLTATTHLDVDGLLAKPRRVRGHGGGLRSDRTWSCIG